MSKSNKEKRKIGKDVKEAKSAEPIQISPRPEIPEPKKKKKG